MLFESSRTCLYKCCPICGGKIFRYILKGTHHFDIDEYGVTCGLQVRDRCEECKEIFAGTGVALNTDSLIWEISNLFSRWEQHVLAYEDFTREIQNLFSDVGGFVSRSC